MRLIGLTGKARAGKDTAGKLIEEWATHNRFTVERHSFAAKLKVSAARAIGFEGDEAECIAFCDDIKHDTDISGYQKTADANTTPDDPHPEEHVQVIGLSGRQYLQLYGTEAHRGVFGSEFWVEALLAPLDDRNRALEAPDLVVVTDARFENEARAIKDRGGEVWEVERPVHDDELDGALDAHVSEAGLPEELIDRTIVNDHDLEWLQREVQIACVETYLR